MPDQEDSKPEQERRVGFALMKQDVATTKKNTEDILKTLRGSNNNPGLITKVALNTQSIGRVWWWVGGISFTLFLGSVGWIIRALLA